MLHEIRADFSLPWSAIEAFERGGPVLDTEAAEAAARDVADLLAGVDTLDRSGIAGPYVAVLDPAHFNVFWQAQASGCGYPASEQVKERVKDVYRSAVIRRRRRRLPHFGGRRSERGLPVARPGRAAPVLRGVGRGPAAHCGRGLSAGVDVARRIDPAAINDQS